MNDYKHTLTVLLLVMSLGGCSNAIKDIQIKDLDAHTISFQRATPTRHTHQEAIKKYQAYINHASSKENHAAALKRLADLQLESSENNSKADILQNTAAIKIMLSSIQHYNTYLQTYPAQKQNDLILYQLAKAYSYNGDFDLALEKINIIASQYPNTKYIDEVQFRRGEMLFVKGDYKKAESAYAAIIKRSPNSMFYEKALYKLAWCQFKQSKYLISLANYFYLLDRKQAQGKLTPHGLAQNLSRTEEDFITDTLRVISLALSYKKGTKTIDLLFAAKTNRNYEALIYKELGNLYLKKHRHADAAYVFLDYGKKHPLKPLAAQYHTTAINAFATGNFHGLVLTTKKSLVKKYGVNTKFWKNQNQKNKIIIKKHLVKNISELANHYHALAYKSKQAEDYNAAASWYRIYLKSFPYYEEAPLINFLLAESLFEAKQYNSAITEYIKTAYQYPKHNKNAEAAYAAILTYNKLIDESRPASRGAIKDKALNNSILFSNTFSADRRAAEVITKTAEQLFAVKKYTMAAEFSRRIIDRKEIVNKDLLKTAWIVYSHSLFELGDYSAAEMAYIEALKRIIKNKSLYTDLADNLAACIYKQGEYHRNKGSFALAAFHFIRLGKIIPTSSIRATAEYNAANMHIRLKQWHKASEILQGFQRNHPSNKVYARSITEKLALIYTNTGEFNLAAKQISILAATAVSLEDKQKLSWQAANMYRKAGKKQTANSLYIQYIKQYRQNFSVYIETHRLVSDYYLNNKKYKKWALWLRKTVAAEMTGGKQRTYRSNLIAAQAVMHLAKPLVNRFTKVSLKIPLQNSLKKKKRLMQHALKIYADVIKYGLAEITTESTYHVAEIYHHFAQALMLSQRPKGLSADELEQYDILLEEQAYPFEEKAIDIHSANTKRTRNGIYDIWVKRSLKVLAEMQPIRYMKKEKIERYVVAIN
jgi:TolA-binding protein